MPTKLFYKALYKLYIHDRRYRFFTSRFDITSSKLLKNKDKRKSLNDKHKFKYKVFR